MACTTFPSTGLVPGVTTHSVGSVLYRWTGVVWEAITAPLESSHIKNEDDSTVQDTTDVIRSILIAQGLSGDYGFFEKGFDYVNVGDVGIDVNGGIYTYAGDGAPNKAVAADTNPVGDSDYKKVEFNTSTHVDFSVFTNQRANFDSYTAGSDAIAGATLRDTFVTARTINGLTDCHAFADRTIINEATDAGTYGTFDSTTEVAGSHNQSHQFSFQDRAEFSGSGTLENWGNIIWPVFSGTGHIDSRIDLQIKELSGLSGDGTIGSHIGIEIGNLGIASSNVALKLNQANGYSIYAPNAGKCWFGGEFRVDGKLNANDNVIIGKALGFKVTPGTGIMIEGKADVAHSFNYFATTNAIGATSGCLGDGKYQLVTNGGARLVIEDSSESHAVRPGVNTQSLGTTSIPWKALVTKEITFIPSDASAIANNSLFIDSADGDMKYKISDETIRTLAFT